MAMPGADLGSSFGGSGSYDFGSSAESSAGSGAFRVVNQLADNNGLYVVIGLVVVAALFLFARKK